MDGSAGIPEWVMWVGAAIGSMLGALVIRLGWKSAGGEKSGPSDGKTFTLDAALVDSGAVRLLTAAIEAHTMEAVAHRSEAEKARQIGYRMVEAVNSCAGEIEELRREIGDLSREIARSK
ncbi:hypothetical protein [Mesorhizobium sp. B2-3-4]|uniref:hypothetical protein n=1 Tax=Mesorhizobium sp. B2-3-4 TaxID=2589959 RepID=UPI00112627D7|nr:hypothetical protein [Mesorhizobium sp. B2-3-4]TPM41527.1 hypothetical protein FJ967_00920 [Mesorhizobium sp. B2-3-4]